MATSVDLQQLALDRGRPARSGPPRHWLTRYVLPLAIVLAFAGVWGWSAGSSLLPSKPVSVVPVVVTRAAVREAGTPLFQAAGWIEPRPGPTVVSALAEGVVEELLVVEGQMVTAGQPVARLIAIDAELALRQAEAELELKQAEVLGAEATLAAAEAQLREPVHLRAALAEAESASAKAKAELKNLPFERQSAQAALALAEQTRRGKSAAGDAVAARSLQRAESELQAARAAVEQLEARRPALEEQAQALVRRREALARQLELKTEENRAVKAAEAALAAAQARREQAEVTVEAAKLRLTRMVLRAPTAGRVLAVHARPGKRLMGLNPGSEHDSSTVVSLYDPGLLQVRADVRLEDIPQVRPGQAVRIETAAIPTPLSGKVLAVTSAADIQKNTLQVKVALLEPPEVVRPEMLAQLTFLAPEPPPEASSEPEQEPLRLLVPRNLVISDAEGSHVWIADQTAQAARKVPVTLGRAGTEELVEVVEGLTPLDKLIVEGRHGLEPGTRIRLVNADAPPR